MRERMIKMCAPTQIVHDRYVLADVRLMLSLWPDLTYFPGRLAELVGADEHDVQAALEALEIDGALCP
jgi:hypothetical protein